MKTTKTARKPRKKDMQEPAGIQPVNTPGPELPSIVRLSNLRTGMVVRMGAKAAQALSTQYPADFKILQA